MNLVDSRKICLMATLFTVCFAHGCGGQDQASQRSKELTGTTDLGPTIGSLTDVVGPEAIQVEGYGLVGGLNGTGSAECPLHIRNYLRRYILTQLPDQKLNIEELINSSDTAVVRLEGVIPDGAVKNQNFDIKVVALQGTQTTSLEDGWLYRAELKPKGTFGISTKVIAYAEGPIFIDKIDVSKPTTRVGYILDGGKALEEYKINLVLRGQNYNITSSVRNRLNERFGLGTAKAVSPGRIELKVPAKYKGQQQKFASIVKAMYLDDKPQIVEERVNTFISEMVNSQNKHDSEIALEAIGNESIRNLSVLLSSFDEQVRLRAARCMLNLGSDQSLSTLREIALDKKSDYRMEAFQAITTAAKRNDAAAISRKLMSDDDFDIKLAAYEQLQKLNDIAVTQKFIARSFYIEQVEQSDKKMIFVSQSGRPRIVLFGAPIYCSENIFVQTTDGSITINAPRGQKYVTIIRKHPRRPEIIIQLRSSFLLVDIIQILCEEPLKQEKKTRIGLGVSYTDMIALLKQMCDKGAVIAEFHAGPLPKID